MLHIVVNDPIDQLKVFAKEWYTGATFPLNYADISEVTEIQADGHELVMILDICHGIPTSKLRVQRWFGDHAKFICGVLKDTSVGESR